MKVMFWAIALMGIASACWARTTVETVPEPSSIVALGSGVVGLGLALWRRR